MLCAGAGFRERLLADPSFLTKMAIEVGIGICTKCTAEYTKRGNSFSKVRGQQHSTHSWTRFQGASHLKASQHTP